MSTSDINTLNTILNTVDIDGLFENDKFVQKKSLLDHIFSIILNTKIDNDLDLKASKALFSI